MNQENNKNGKLVDWTLVLSSVVCLLPLLFSAAVYRDLPAQLAIHWNDTGVADGFLPKALGAFGLPFLMLAINLICHVSMNSDPKRRGQAKAAVLLGKWCVPVLSLILVPVTLLIALGTPILVGPLVSCLVGVLFILLGNYLPKCRQNYTVGIKLPWTLHDEDNWDKTHRMAGWLWILGGAAFILSGFLGRGWLHIAIVIVLVIAPVAYSFALYLRKKT